MKIEFLDDITDGGKYPNADPTQLVRLFHFDTLQAKQLRNIIQVNIIDDSGIVDLSLLDFVQVINCDLTLKISNFDKGITTSDNSKFTCDLTMNGYKKMIFLMEPFCDKDTNGYQWLYDLDTPIDFLFSPGGLW